MHFVINGLICYIIRGIKYQFRLDYYFSTSKKGYFSNFISLCRLTYNVFFNLHYKNLNYFYNKNKNNTYFIDTKICSKTFCCLSVDKYMCIRDETISARACELKPAQHGLGFRMKMLFIRKL